VLKLRAALLLGLVAHKAVWELLKTGGSTQSVARPPRSPLVKAVKSVKVAVLAGLVIQTLALNLLPISHRPRAIRWIGAILYALGLGTAIAARFQLGRSWSNIEDADVLSDHSLVTRGVYRYVRHPIYIGDVLLVAGLELALNSWLALLSAPLFLVVLKQAISEEKTLVGVVPGYEAYRERTTRFIPFVL
jgi:protein-S-isoprenylcysteine O-methyltransferase Ste14